MRHKGDLLISIVNNGTFCKLNYNKNNKRGTSAKISRVFCKDFTNSSAKARKEEYPSFLFFTK